MELSASASTIIQGVPPVTAHSLTSADVAVPPATLSLAVQASLGGVRVVTNTRATAPVTVANDKVRLLVRNCYPPVSIPIMFIFLTANFPGIPILTP